MLAQVRDWAGYLALDVDEAEAAVMRRHERTGRPLGDAACTDPRIGRRTHDPASR